MVSVRRFAQEVGQSLIDKMESSNERINDGWPVCLLPPDQITSAARDPLSFAKRCGGLECPRVVERYRLKKVRWVSYERNPYQDTSNTSKYLQQDYWICYIIPRLYNYLSSRTSILLASLLLDNIGKYKECIIIRVLKANSSMED